MSIAKELKEFALKGNVIDLAVGVVIGGAFGKIVTGLVNDFIMPLVGLVTPSGDWRQAGIKIGQRAGEHAGDDPVDIMLKWGDFAGVTLDFIIVALVLFVVIKAVNRFKPAPPPTPPAPATRECPACLEQVAKKATRCKFCTTELAKAE